MKANYNWVLHYIYENWLETSSQYENVLVKDLGLIYLNENVQQSWTVDQDYSREVVTDWKVSAETTLGIPMAKEYIGDTKISASYGQTTTVKFSRAVGTTIDLVDGQGPGWYRMSLIYPQKRHYGTIMLYNQLGCLTLSGPSPADWVPDTDKGAIQFNCVLEESDTGGN